MKIKTLIKLLQNCNPDDNVYVQVPRDRYSSDGDFVKISKIWSGDKGETGFYRKKTFLNGKNLRWYERKGIERTLNIEERIR